jgi:hypothetical protein
MASWRVAKSLNQLLAEINTSAPNRSKVSDGSIGDEDHQSTSSDHNPWCQGWVVTARDFTHDPSNGFDSYAYAEWQRKRCRGDILLNGQRETRVKYIISNRRIASPTQNWAWRTYTGSNPHDRHVHVSVDCTAEGGNMDSVTPWGWSKQEDYMWCKQGDKGTEAVWNLQQRLWFMFDNTLVVDGVYGAGTAVALAAALAPVAWVVDGTVFNRGEVAALEWAVAVKAAKQFGTGQPGPTGPAGPPGPPGPPGKNAEVGVGTVLTVTTAP